MAKRPTEEDLDLGPTPEEIEALKQPAAVEDDAPITSEEDDDIHQIAAPKAEAAAEDKPARIKDPVTGKFVAKDAAEAAKQQPDTRTVDLRALQEERAARRELEGRMNTLLEVINKREARAAKTEEPPPPAVPDKILDPLGNIDHRFDDISARLARFEGESKAQTEARQAQERENAQYQEVLGVAVPQFNEATKADPALPQLQSALLESFARELAYNNGIPLDAATPQQRAFIERELNNLERAHIASAVSRGVNVADYMRGLAQSRGVTLPAAAAAAPAAKPAARSIPERQAAQQRHMSLGDLPGSAAPSTLSAKDLAKMTPKEFAAFAKKLGDAGMDQLFQEA